MVNKIMPALWQGGFGYTKNVLSWRQETRGLFLEKGIVERVKNMAGKYKGGNKQWRTKPILDVR